MKTLYQILLEERGTLRPQFDYTELVEKLIDIIIDQRLFDPKVIPYNVQYFISANQYKELKQFYPSWIEKFDLLMIPQAENRKKVAGSYDPTQTKFKDNKLSFVISINLDVLARLFEQPNLKAFRSTCRQTLQHELKHAFDDWIKLSKNLVPKHKEYHTVLNFIKGTNLPPEWKTCFEHCAYLLSKVEISAHQQQYLDFYKNHPLGQYYIDLLRSRYKTASNYCDYLIEADKESYEYHQKWVCLTACRDIEDFTPENFHYFFFTKHEDLLNEISVLIETIPSLNETLLDDILNVAEQCYRYNYGKIVVIQDKKQKLSKILSVYQTDTYKFLSKRIFSKVF